MHPDHSPGANDTHVLEYTPGMRASVTLCGSGCSQRSGLHACASGPQIAGSRLIARMPTTTFVLDGMGMCDVCVPSTPVTGFESGRTASARVLRKIQT